MNLGSIFLLPELRSCVYLSYGGTTKILMDKPHLQQGQTALEGNRTYHRITAGSLQGEATALTDHVAPTRSIV